MNDDAQLKEKLFKVVTKLGKIANGLKIAAIPVLVLNILVITAGFIYFYQASDLGHWRWGIPTLIMVIPIISASAIIWILDAVTCVPAAVKSASGEVLNIVKHHRKKLDTLSNNRISKFKYLRTIGKILWESTDVIDGVGMASFIATPFFWFFYAGAFLGSFILSGILVVTMILHYIFS